nr:AraC family transcriptional regulator [uncultured Ruminococcus sp.]
MSAYQETKVHGTHDFPFAVYRGLVPDWLSDFPLHWHEEMEIIYVEKGSVSISIRNTEYLVHGGDFVLIHPQTIHSIRQHEEDRGFYHNILFRLSMLESGIDDLCRKKYLEPIYQRQLLMPEYVDPAHPLSAKIAPTIRELLTYQKDRQFGDEMLIKAKLIEILYHIITCCEVSDKERAYEDIIFDKLKLSLNYLEENYAENITAEAMAAVSNYSVSHFSKLFKQMTGESLTQYLKNYRLEIAANRLRNEPTKVSEIALSCGFANLSYFSRAFYHKYHITPTEYRKITEE